MRLQPEPFAQWRGTGAELQGDGRWYWKYVDGYSAITNQSSPLIFRYVGLYIRAS